MHIKFYSYAQVLDVIDLLHTHEGARWSTTIKYSRNYVSWLGYYVLGLTFPRIVLGDEIDSAKVVIRELIKKLNFSAHRKRASNLEHNAPKGISKPYKERVVLSFIWREDRSTGNEAFLLDSRVANTTPRFFTQAVCCRISNALLVLLLLLVSAPYGASSECTARHS